MYPLIDCFPNHSIFMNNPTCRMATICLLLIGSASAEPTVLLPRILDETINSAPAVIHAFQPGLVVPAADVVSLRVLKQGECEITVQEIKPMALPQPVAGPSTLNEAIPAIKERLAHLSQEVPDYKICRVGATVYHSESSESRSLFTYQSGELELQLISFWSSMDASLLQAISQYVGADGIPRGLVMAWSVGDMNSISVGSDSQEDVCSSVIPEFPGGPATYFIVEENPS
jgi:hypothetical protein